MESVLSLTIAKATAFERYLLTFLWCVRLQPIKKTIVETQDGMAGVVQMDTWLLQRIKLRQ